MQFASRDAPARIETELGERSALRAALRGSTACGRFSRRGFPRLRVKPRPLEIACGTATLAPNTELPPSPRHVTNLLEMIKIISGVVTKKKV